jgi:hypothetical protein
MFLLKKSPDNCQALPRAFSICLHYGKRINAEIKSISVLRLWDVYPGSRILIFIHPGSDNSNKRGEENVFVVIPFLGASNFTKFNHHNALKKYGLEIREKPIPDPGVKKALDPGSGSATLFYFYNLTSPYCLSHADLSTKKTNVTCSKEIRVASGGLCHREQKKDREIPWLSAYR